MSAAELRYMLATHQLGERGSGVRLTDIADRMGVTKVSVYRMSERLEVMGMMTRGEVALIVAQKGLSCGIISSAYFAPVILLILISSVVTPIVLKALYSRSEKKAQAAKTV